MSVPSWSFKEATSDVLLDPQAGIMVQGITGREARAMVSDMLDYGSYIVGGVTPGKEGQDVNGLPVYDTVFLSMIRSPVYASSIAQQSL